MRDDIAEFSGNFDNIFTAALQSVIIASSEWDKSLLFNDLVTDTPSSRQWVERRKHSEPKSLTISDVSGDTWSTDHVSDHRFRFLRIIFAFSIGSSVDEFLAGRLGGRGGYWELSSHKKRRQEWLRRLKVSASRS